MICAQCPFVIPCWSGLYYRSVCKCGTGMMHESLAISYLIVRCPRPSPVPANKAEQACPDCSFDKWKGYLSDATPGCEYYRMVLDPETLQGKPLERADLQQMFDRMSRQKLVPTRYILYWSDKPEDK